MTALHHTSQPDARQWTGRTGREQQVRDLADAGHSVGRIVRDTGYGKSFVAAVLRAHRETRR